MSQPAEKSWYDDGGLMLFLACVAAFVYFMWFTPKQQPVEIQIFGRVDQGLFGGETLKVTCWHIFPGTLEKGRITVLAESTSLAKGEVLKYHSFDAWPPNKEHQVTVDFPLHEVERSAPIRLSIQIVAQNAKDSHYQIAWDRNTNTWSTPLVDLSPR